MFQNVSLEMEQFKKLLCAAQQGDESALTQLDFHGFLEVDYGSITVTEELLNTVYNAISMSRIAAHLLHRDILSASCRFLLELSHFLSRSYFKKPCQYNYTTEDVLQKMKIMLKHSVEFCVSRGEKAETSRLLKNIHWYQEKVKDAIGGDPVCKRDLGVEDLPRLTITAHKTVIPLRELDVTFRRAHEIAAAAKVTGDTTLERVNSYTLSILDCMQRVYYPGASKLKPTADAQDICDSVLNEVNILNTWVSQVEPVRMREVVSESKEKEREYVAEEQDPSYDPRDDSSKTSEDIIPGTPQADVGRSVKTVIPTFPSQQPDPVSVPDAELCCTGQSEEADAVSVSFPPAPDAQGRSTGPSEKADSVHVSAPKAVRVRKTAADVKQSHHRKLNCPLCTSEVFDLKRHLRSHVKKDGLPEHKINQVYSVAVVQNKRRGPPRKSNDGSRAGLPYKWCPFQGCEMATHRLKSHLTHYHRLRPGALLDGYLKVAKIYRGKKEKRSLADLLHVSSDSEDDSSSPPARKVLATATSTQPTTTLPPPPAIPLSTSDTETTAGSDDDEEFMDRVLQEDFFTCPTPSSKRHQWLVTFHKFLNLPDAGRKKDRNRLQHASHIRTILEDLDPSGKDVEIVSQDEGYIRLVTDEKKLLKMAAKPTYVSSKIFNENLVAVHKIKETLTLNRPAYVGMCILDLSKTLMYDFHYNYIKQKYGSKAKLLFTDTDSLTYEIEARDVYSDFWNDKDKFDNSDYPESSPYFDKTNKKVIGKFKDEAAGIPITEFVGLRSKMYSYVKDNQTGGKTAKGIKRNIIRKDITHENYKQTLLENKQMCHTMKTIRSQNHELKSYEINKVSLSCFDDKRYIHANGVTSYAYGHYKI